MFVSLICSFKTKILTQAGPLTISASQTKIFLYTSLKKQELKMLGYFLEAKNSKWFKVYLKLLSPLTPDFKLIYLSSCTSDPLYISLCSLHCHNSVPRKLFKNPEEELESTFPVVKLLVQNFTNGYQ